MINYIWLGLLAFGICFAGYQDLTGVPVPEDVSEEARSWMAVATASAADRAEGAIDLAISLVGIMALWLGIMKIAEEAGLVRLLARMLKPIMVLLFPQLPPDGEAMGAIIMNMAANMLGLGNAATPLGIKAMEELQKVNENKEYASNAMCMLLAMNTSSVTIIPTTIIAYRVANHSAQIMDFLPLMIIATTVSTIVAVSACLILERLPIFKVPAPAATRAGNSEGGAS